MKQPTWPYIRLGEVAEFRNGINYNKDNFGKGLKVVNVKDFQNRLIADLSNLDEINPEGIVREECYLKDGDIIFVRSNGNRELIGRSMLVKGVTGPVSHSAFSIKVRFGGNRAVPSFYAYVFRTELIRTELSNRGGGTNISNLNQDILDSLQVPSPPVSTQRKIVGILSAYDDLIENNTRRIAILETMAQAIYREWFVEFRFPGHEKIKLVNSPLGNIPEGWKPMTLEQVCVDKKGIQTGPFGSQLHQSDYSEDGVPVVMPKDIIQSRISLDSIARVPEDICERLARHRLEVGDTVYGRRGDIGRRAFVGKAQSGWLCGTGCMRLRPKSALISPRFLFDSLGRPETVGLIVGKAAGAIMPNLNIGILSSIPVIVPQISIQTSYDQIVEPFWNQVEVLGEKNKRLRATRDLLLPKLISGQLNVEDLDIDIGEPMTE